MQRLHGASCCMQLVYDSSSVTAQVNTAVVRGQKAENCKTHSEISASRSELPTKYSLYNNLFVASVTVAVLRMSS